MRDEVLTVAAALAAVFGGAGAAHAQLAGAPAAQPVQPGAWGPQGWQYGAAAPVQPAPPPVMAAAPVQATPAPSRLYTRIEPGRRLKGAAAAPANTVADPQGWGLPQPPAGTRWVRYYDDAVLLDGGDRVVDVRGVPWDMPRTAPAPVPAPLYVTAPPRPPVPVRAPGTYTTRRGDTVVTTQVMPAPAAVGSYGPYGQVVSVTPGTITTTTRTTWVRDAAPSRNRRARRR